jgi:hypothetical protein
MNSNQVFEDLFVLELANNHWGRLERGLRIVTDFSRIVRFNNVRAAIKIQLRDVDAFIHKDFREREDIRYIKKTLDTRLGKNDYAALVRAIRKSGCIPMATPFDEKSVALCDELGVDILKLASSDLNDWILIEKVAATKKPVIVSTGGSSPKDVDDLVRFFANRNIPLAINHCVSLYPSEDHELELNQIDYLRRPLSRQHHRLFHPRASRLEQFDPDAGLRQGRAHLRAPHRHRGRWHCRCRPIAACRRRSTTGSRPGRRRSRCAARPARASGCRSSARSNISTGLVRGVYARHDLPAGHALV